MVNKKGESSLVEYLGFICVWGGWDMSPQLFDMILSLSLFESHEQNSLNPCTAYRNSTNPTFS